MAGMMGSVSVSEANRRRPASAPPSKTTRGAKEDNEVNLVLPQRRRRKSSRQPIDRGTELMRRRTRKSPNHLIWTVSRSVLDRDPVADAVQQTVSMYELGLKPQSQQRPVNSRRSGGESSLRQPAASQRRPASADPAMATTPGGHVNTPVTGRYGRATPGANTPGSNRTPHSARGTPLIARGGSRSATLLDDVAAAAAGTPAGSTRQRPQSAGARPTGSTALLLQPTDSSLRDEDSTLTTPGGRVDYRELTDFQPFINCSASRFVDFVLDPTVEPPRYAKPGERSAAYELAEQRAPGPAQRAARHRQRRENGERVRRRKAEREEAWVTAKIEHITRRERQKAELLFQRDNKRLLARQRGMLVQVAFAARLQRWVSGVKTARAEKEDYWAEHRAALAIGAWYRTRMMLKKMRTKNGRRTEACVKIQRWWRGVMLFKWTEARQRAANDVIAVTRAMHGSGKLQELIRVFRYKIVRIQKSWRESRMRQAAEVALCVRKWEKTRKYLLARESELQEAISNVKEERSISQRERVVKREALEKELEELPKMPVGAGRKAITPPNVMKIIAERWVREHRDSHKTVLRAYFVQLDHYNKQYAAMASKLAARQLMGARVSGVDGLPSKPERPFYHVLPTVLDVVGMVKAGLKLRKKNNNA
jgi:hypothetical protein